MGLIIDSLGIREREGITMVANLKDIIEIVDKFSKEELNLLREEVNKKINSKVENGAIYTHECCYSSDYHLRKYKHYSKKLDYIDDTKENGYAFIGKFLKVDKENLVPVGSFIVEVCDKDIYLYKVGNDNKELLLQGRYKEIVSFIKESKEITGL